MLRNRGTADGEVFRDLADGCGTAQELFENGAAGGVAQSVELRFSVSHHLRKIRLTNAACQCLFRLGTLGRGKLHA